MGWVKDFWDGIAQFFGYDYWAWGSAGEWFAAIGTVLAIFATLAVSYQSLLENRRSHVSLLDWDYNPHSGGMKAGNIFTTIHNLTFRNNSDSPFNYVRFYTQDKIGLSSRGLFSSAGFKLPAHSSATDSPFSDDDAGEFKSETFARVLIIPDRFGRTWYRHVDGDRSYIPAWRMNLWDRGWKIPFTKYKYYRKPIMRKRKKRGGFR